MQIFKILPAIALAVSACTVPAGTTSSSSSQPTSFTPVTWKENTPRATRNYDQIECELQGRGLDFSATEEEITAATNTIPVEQVTSFVRRCLDARGYTVTEKPVCSDAQASEAVSQGRFQRPPEFLPPLSTVKCMVVDQGFVV
ncbi:hypothetical protein [Algicella marina]|uniref:Lipoprotein n=1 Tax=Algicella marina TaxID=2683284 RepID=A0A6P1SYM7_9RHOB|nr:hypothetical protein [Algicella marina]QHQ34316.1 hypothetical protein GO499_03465 [Algicella marina]